MAFARGTSHLMARLDEARAASQAVEIGVSRALSTASVAALLAAAAMWVIAYRAVRRWRRDVEGLQTALSQAREALIGANVNLERQVAERTGLAEARAREVERLAHEVVTVEALERQCLARILHDHLQQLLVGARLQLGLQAEVRGTDPYGRRAAGCTTPTTCG